MYWASIKGEISKNNMIYGVWQHGIAGSALPPIMSQQQVETPPSCPMMSAAGEEANYESKPVSCPLMSATGEEANYESKPVSTARID